MDTTQALSSIGGSHAHKRIPKHGHPWPKAQARPASRPHALFLAFTGKIRPFTTARGEQKRAHENREQLDDTAMDKGTWINVAVIGGRVWQTDIPLTWQALAGSARSSWLKLTATTSASTPASCRRFRCGSFASPGRMVWQGMECWLTPSVVLLERILAH